MSADTPANLELPSQWLWGIIDEFIYHFQALSQFSSKLSKKTDGEIDNLKVWNVHSVLKMLHSLVGKSNINKQEEVAVPEPGEDQVLVRVVCAGVNPVETYIREGQYAK